MIANPVFGADLSAVFRGEPLQGRFGVGEIGARRADGGGVIHHPYRVLGRDMEGVAGDDEVGTGRGQKIFPPVQVRRIVWDFGF